MILLNQVVELERFTAWMHRSAEWVHRQRKARIDAEKEKALLELIHTLNFQVVSRTPDRLTLRHRTGSLTVLTDYMK
jgi:beta-lactamase class D